MHIALYLWLSCAAANVKQKRLLLVRTQPERERVNAKFIITLSRLRKDTIQLKKGIQTRISFAPATGWQGQSFSPSLNDDYWIITSDCLLYATFLENKTQRKWFFPLATIYTFVLTK
jgi:hypothetical protein